MRFAPLHLSGIVTGYFSDQDYTFKNSYPFQCPQIIRYVTEKKVKVQNSKCKLVTRTLTGDIFLQDEDFNFLILKVYLSDNTFT